MKGTNFFDEELKIFLLKKTIISSNCGCVGVEWLSYHLPKSEGNKSLSEPQNRGC